MINDEKKKTIKDGFINFTKNVGETAKTVGEASKNVVANISDTVVENSTKLGEQINQYIDKQNLKKLAPIFEEDILKSDFVVPAIVQIVNYDKRMENRLCKRAVGFETKINNVKVLTIYSDYTDLINKRFYPQEVPGTYYVNPCIRDLYIDINDFFSYMKKVRVDELDSIAQMLGAKHFKIELQIQESNSNITTAKTSGSLRLLKTNADYATSNNTSLNVSVAAESYYKGNTNPQKPELLYFKNDSSINSLIEMRTDPQRQNSLISKTYSIQYGKTSGITMEQTADIGAALKSLNCGMADEFTRNAQNECNTILQYTIDF